MANPIRDHREPPVRLNVNLDSECALTVVINAIESDTSLVLDQIWGNERRVQFSTKPNLFGWGEVCTVYVYPTLDGSEVTLHVRDRHSGQPFKRFFHAYRLKNVTRLLTDATRIRSRQP
ncbi:MAG: hypothetical protein WAS54_03515 [Scrofimicrobium sp.]